MKSAAPASRELTQTEERMRSIVNHVIDGIITIDEHGAVESFNPAAEKLFGYPRAEVIGRNVKLLMPEPYHSEHDGYLANYRETGHAKIIGIGREVLGRRKDGSTFPMELAVSEFHAGTRRFFTGIVRDITDRKQLEQELRRRLHELAEADREKNEFLAMLGHELRNPLAPMRNALHLMKMPGTNNELVAQARDVLERQLEYLVRMVDDLLDVSRM
ncbi:MAG: PAS domain S-box protein, partial [Betaproteobacteria bacterium]|nr:PAS domain S-box protein [Betaproteobacteria bacterium]